MEKLKEAVDQMKQGKESAEEKIRTMSNQMLISFQQYRDGFDEILERNKTEFEETKRKLEDEIKQLRTKVCWAEVFCVEYSSCYTEKLNHWVCNAAYLVPLPSQYKLGGLLQEGIWSKNDGDDGDGAPIVQMEWHVGVSASVIFPLHHKTQKMACVTPWAPPHEWVNVFAGTISPG